MDIQTRYKKALDFIKNPPKGSNIRQSDTKQPNNQQKLKFYALFKQITQGQNKTKQPSKFKIVQSYKWNEWKKLGSMSKQDAMKKYIQVLNQINPNWQNPSAKL